MRRNRQETRRASVGAVGSAIRFEIKENERLTTRRLPRWYTGGGSRLGRDIPELENPLNHSENED
jgi:hypothetical protein